MDVLMKAFLRKEADALNQPVKDFMECQVVYQIKSADDKELIDYDRKAPKFQKVVNAVEKWLRAVALCSLLEDDSKTSETISLTMPEEDSLDVRASMDRAFGDCFSSLKDDNIYTPIGSMRAYVCEAIVNVEENPVLLLYQFFDEQIKMEHRLIAEKGGNVPILSGSILNEYGIVDLLGIYKLDTLMEGINRFLHPESAGTGAGVPIK